MSLSLCLCLVYVHLASLLTRFIAASCLLFLSPSAYLQLKFDTSRIYEELQKSCRLYVSQFNFTLFIFL